MGILVTVKWKHIRTGKSRNRTRCPIALALREQGLVGEGSILLVDESEVEYEENGFFHFSTLPRSAQRFIQKFDQHKPVKPFRFILEETGTFKPHTYHTYPEPFSFITQASQT